MSHGTGGRGGDAARGVLRGIPASRGTAVGKARLVRTPDDFHAVQRGEIIIAPATTPAWTPLFGVAAGLITEFGGLLSHSGVVAREYGCQPCWAYRMSCACYMMAMRSRWMESEAR